MTCQGKCTITKSESRRLRLGKFRKDNESCPNLSRSEGERAVRTYLAPILADAPAGCAGGGDDAPACLCVELPDQDPKWGPWRTYRKEIPYTRRAPGGLVCNYTIGFEVQIRRRVFDGVCYLETLPDAAVDLDDAEVMLVRCAPVRLPFEAGLWDALDFVKEKDGKKD